jgi:hypothetical protein
MLAATTMLMHIQWHYYNCCGTKLCRRRCRSGLCTRSVGQYRSAKLLRMSTIYCYYDAIVVDWVDRSGIAMNTARKDWCFVSIITGLTRRLCCVWRYRYDFILSWLVFEQFSSLRCGAPCYIYGIWKWYCCRNDKGNQWGTNIFWESKAFDIMWCIDKFVPTKYWTDFQKTSWAGLLAWGGV